jgi:hypothetical protein
MDSPFEELWKTAADDGAACLAGVYLPRVDEGEVERLLDAWYRERTDRIECALMLDQARRLLTDLLADEEISPRHRRQAGRLIRAIRSIRTEDETR